MMLANYTHFFVKSAVSRRLPKDNLLNLGYKGLLFLCTIFTSIIASAPLNADEQNVKPVALMSSIKPIQLIASAIVGDLGESDVLLPPSANPHQYQLRPSQIARLNSTDLFIWVGPQLELFLVNILKNRDINHLALTKNLGINTLTDEAEDHGKHNEHPSDSAHHHGDNDHHAEHNESNDPHIWLDPALAARIAEVIYHHSAKLYPSLTSQLKQNLDTFKQHLSIKDDDIRSRLKSLRGTDIYSFHDVYSHFADHYGLVVAGHITRTPESRPGAKHLSELTSEIKSKKTICLIKEPNFKAPYIEHLTGSVNVISTTIDPVAGDINNSVDGYIEFIEKVASGFMRCAG